MDIVTVHYNTPEMMECMIRSLNMRTVCRIHVIDNSDEYPFENKFNNVEVIDNTRGQLINYDEWLKNFPDRKCSVRTNFGSAKHCKMVDMCFDMFPKGFILMDSDVLVKKDVTTFWDESKAWVGEVLLDRPDDFKIKRVAPFLCYLNVPLLRKYDVRYFNRTWMWRLTQKEPNKHYDTGAWFYKDCVQKSVPYREMRLDPYIEHYFHGSHAWLNETLPDWLERFKELWL